MCFKIRLVRCVARSEICLSVPLSELKMDILIYLCNWIWVGCCNLNVISFILSPERGEPGQETGGEIFAKDEVPTFQTTRSHGQVLVLHLAGFKPDPGPTPGLSARVRRSSSSSQHWG